MTIRIMAHNTFVMTSQASSNGRVEAEVRRKMLPKLMSGEISV